MGKILTKLFMLTLLAIPVSAALHANAAALPNWDTTGNYVIAVNYVGTDYAHDITLAQNATGDLTGNGGSPTGTHVYTWDITSGTVTGDTIDLYANYTATADAVSPLTVMHIMGTIAPNGSMSGTWTDNYQGGSRSGTWTSTSGLAESIQSSATLAAEDFGVVDYATGLGQLRGYTAGFGLTDATFENVQSVVVKLYAGATLLQTNTATPNVGIDITGTQISSPFDVSGNFNYAADGYWTNVRQSQYGQSIPATRVVATVTLEDGTVVTAENLVLTGNATSIYPTTTPVVTSPTTKNQCKNNGWKTFTNPTFTNQGQCVSFVERLTHEQKNCKNKDSHKIKNTNTHHETKSHHGSKNHGR